MIYLALVLSYLIGSISFAIVVSLFFKMDDPRSYGSQNAGATNVMRSGNKKAAAFTLIGDLLKGTIVVLISKHYFSMMDNGAVVVALCGIAVIIGHIYPIFFKFKGGKGVATAIGVFLGLNPLLALLLVVTWTIIFKVFKVSSLSALIATVLSPVYAYILMGNNAYFGAVLIIAFIILYTHKSNIIRIATGKEHSFKNKE